MSKSIVYFIQHPEDGMIKIGFTANLKFRLTQLNREYGADLRVLATIEGGYEVEQALHTRFRSSWRFGEWFRASDDIQAFIATEATPYQPATEIAKPTASSNRIPRPRQAPKPVKRETEPLQRVTEDARDAQTVKLFSTKEAAEYLGISVQGVKYHVYTTKKLTGQTFGKTLVFTQEELDEFLRHQRVRRAAAEPQADVTPGAAEPPIRRRRKAAP